MVFIGYSCELSAIDMMPCRGRKKITLVYTFQEIFPTPTIPEPFAAHLAVIRGFLWHYSDFFFLPLVSSRPSCSLFLFSSFSLAITLLRSSFTASE